MLPLTSHVVPAIRIVSGDASWVLPVGIVAAVVGGVLWLMARVRESRDKEARRQAQIQGHDTGAFQQDHAAYAVAGGRVQQGAEARGDARTEAWNALFDPDTAPARLAEIAARHPEFAAQIAVHPQAYEELRSWARQTSEGPS